MKDKNGNEFDHPCKQTCSGWQQGRDRGYAEGQKDAAKDLFERPTESAKIVDKIVCDWSMKFGVALTETQQIALVDALAELDITRNDEGSGT